jgi:hypothetical protein
MMGSGIPSIRGSNVPWGPMHGPCMQTFVQALYLDVTLGTRTSEKSNTTDSPLGGGRGPMP